MIHINSTIVIIILNTNGLNIPITRQPLIKMDKKDLTIKGRRKIYYANMNKKEDGVAILIIDKAGFRTKKMIKDIE